MSVISDLLFPDSAEVAGTQRVESVQSEEVTAEGGVSVIRAMLDAGESAAMRLIAGTQTGKKLATDYAAASAAQAAKDWGPLLLVIALVLVFVFAGGRRVSA